MSTPAGGEPVLQLQPHECWATLRTVELGRLAFVADGVQEILPVNFVVDQGSLVLRTGAMSRIHLVADGRPLAFEADGTDDGLAWSVVVRGHAKEVQGLYESVDAAGLPLHPQQGGAKDRMLRITVDEVSGRRFAMAAASRWETPLTSARRSAPE